MAKKSNDKILIEKFNAWDFDGLIELYKSGANPNIRNEYGDTLLAQACWYARLDLVELLIQNNVDINADNGHALLLTILCKNDNTALTKGNPVKIVKLLIEHGADVNMKYKTRYQSESNANALILAIKNRKQGMATQLLNAGSDVHHKDSHGYNALWWAKDKGFDGLVKKIKEKMK